MLLRCVSDRARWLLGPSPHVGHGGLGQLGPGGPSSLGAASSTAASGSEGDGGVCGGGDAAVSLGEGCEAVRPPLPPAPQPSAGGCSVAMPVGKEAKWILKPLSAPLQGDRAAESSPWAELAKMLLILS